MTPTPYTLTGAADWEMFVFMCGGLGILLVLLFAIIGFMWRDLKRDLEKGNQFREKLCDRKHASVNREFDALWDEINIKSPRQRAREHLNEEVGS